MESSDRHRTLGSALRTARRKAKLTQEQMATVAGCSRPTVRAAERGSCMVGLFARLAANAGAVVDGCGLPSEGPLGARLRGIRLRQRMSVRALSAKTGICQAAIAEVEADSQHCRLSTVATVAAALGIQLRLVPEGGMGFWGRTASSSVHGAWTSPAGLLERLYPLVGGRFDLDPCAPSKPAERIRADRHYTADDDGLALPWHGDAVYLNPPYGRGVTAWMAKAVSEVASGRTRLVIALLPARTDTRWWHEKVAGKAHVVLLRGRLRFGAEGSSDCAPFPSAIVAWGGLPDFPARLRGAFPDDWHIPAAAPVTVGVLGRDKDGPARGCRRHSAPGPILEVGRGAPGQAPAEPANAVSAGKQGDVWDPPGPPDALPARPVW